MLRRLRLRVSATQKLVLGAVLLIALPLSVLGVLHYSFLTKLQASTRTALRENLQQTLQAAAAQAQRDMESLGRETLLTIPEEEPARELGKRFAQTLDLHPEIEQIFVFRPARVAGGRCTLYVYSAAGMQKFEDEHIEHSMSANHVFVAHHQAVMGPGAMAGSKGEFLFAQHSCALCRGTGMSDPLYIFHPTTPLAGHDDGGFVALMVDPDYLQKTYLGGLMSNLLDRSDSGQFRPAIAVFDPEKREIFSSSHGASYAVQSSFAPVFPHWQLAIGYQRQTLEALARETFLRTLLMTSIVLLVLVGGLLLMFRAAAREIKLAEMKSAFVSNVSHELETPLSLIRLLAETLELGRVKDEQKSQEYYRMIHSESCRLTQLINNILDFSKIEAGRREYRLTRQDAGIVIEELLATYRQQIQSEGFELTVQIDRPLPPVLMDGDAISRTVLNLVNNAVKYSTQTKMIRVHVYHTEKAVAIEVADRGIGISRTDLKRIFEKFYRAGSELVHETKGSGLGLSLVKHIVEAHHGTIKVESALGKGSTFTILLPAYAAETAASGGYELAKNPDC